MNHRQLFQDYNDGLRIDLRRRYEAVPKPSSSLQLTVLRPGDFGVILTLCHLE